MVEPYPKITLRTGSMSGYILTGQLLERSFNCRPAR
jgi:hypothetical protein